MKTTHLLAALVALALSPSLHAAEEPQTPEQRERGTALQIFLDRENFNPGKIDGRWGEFTRKALERYQRAQGGTPPEYGDQTPESLDLPLDKVNPVFIDYSVTEDDVSSIGSVPNKPEEQAKQKEMPYQSVLELVAERFHADIDFVRDLNPDRNMDELKAGDSLMVPNVQEPFKIAEVRARAESEKKSSDEEKPKADEAKDAPTHKIEISTSEKMLDLMKDGKIVASFPITPGSESLPAPQGDWKITSITYMPWFRHDEKMLKEGERSDDAHNIPPGPNNAVGIVWMALDKKGIGMHGTSAPDTIGRSSSHGCIRLSNWDAWKLSNMVGDGTPVTIR